MRCTGGGTLYYNLHKSLQNTRFDFSGTRHGTSREMTSFTIHHLTLIEDRRVFTWEILGDTFRADIAARWWKVRCLKLSTNRSTISCAPP